MVKNDEFLLKMNLFNKSFVKNEKIRNVLKETRYATGLITYVPYEVIFVSYHPEALAKLKENYKFHKEHFVNSFEKTCKNLHVDLVRLKYDENYIRVSFRIHPIYNLTVIHAILWNFKQNASQWIDMHLKEEEKSVKKTMLYDYYVLYVRGTLDPKLLIKDFIKKARKVCK